MLVIALLGFLVPILQASSRCSAPNATTYLRSEGTRLMEFSTKVMKDVTLNECATACSNSLATEECLSFEYDASILQCSHHSDDGQPFGASVLAKASQTISFFQQICLLDEAVCNAPYSFERFPQSVLIGHAMKVLTVDGLSDCLSKCALAQKSYNFLCKSAIYYYETGECIMNRDSKFIYPKLFKTNILDTLVDYFENNCADVACRAEETLHWVRTEEYLIDESKDVIVESSDAQECNQLCQNNKIGEERFPCKAFAYSNSKQECHLTAESSYVGHKGDKRFNLAPLNSGEYFEKYCLPTNLQCIEASFELVANRMMTSAYKTIPSLSQHECLSQCMKDGARCASVTYFYMDDECQLSDVSQFSRPNEFVVANFTDYFDKICDPSDPKIILTTPETPPELIQNSVDEEVTTSERTVAQGAANFEVATTSNSVEFEDDNLLKDNQALEAVHGVTTTKNSGERRESKAEVEGTVIDDADEFSREVEDREEAPLTSSEESEGRVKARLSTECRMSGISVSIKFAAPTSGTIYIKDHFSSCRQPFSNTTFAELHIPFPTEDDSKCGGIESEPHKWDYNVVVERNDMKTPSLVTTKDKTFQVTCDFSKIADKNQLAALKPKVEGDQKSEKILMEIVRNGQAVTTVPLGAEVSLRWTVIDHSENLGFFINECIAERVGGQPPHPEPLKIIYQGCPEEKVRNRLLHDPVAKKDDVYSTKMKVFRFDGSRRVRIKCSIDVCVETCPPVICDDLEIRNVDSYGRKKRSSSVEKWLKAGQEGDGQKRGGRRRRMVTGTLTITDEEDEKTRRNGAMVKPRPEFSTSSSSSSSASQQHYCVQKDRVEFVVVIVVLLILLQIGLALFFYKKCVARRIGSSGSVYSEGSSESSVTSSAYNTCSRQTVPGQGPVLPVRPSKFADGAPFTENPYNRLHHFT